jgi:hypothetical protein
VPYILAQGAAIDDNNEDQVDAGIEDNLHLTSGNSECKYSGTPVDGHLSYVTTPPRRPNFPSPEWFPL